MKTIHIIFSAIIALSLSACEKVIDLNLKNAKPIVVIEGNVTDVNIPQVVKVTQSKSFTEDNTVTPILNATITVKDLTLNKTYNFGSPDNQGNYSSNTFKGIAGNTYELTVLANNVTYTAKSTMPQKVALDSISVTEVSFFGDAQKYIKVNYTDPLQFENQYRYLLTVNNELVKGYFVDSDRFNNGKYVSNTIFTNDPKLKSGDEIKVEFQCIDMTTYRYFYAISQIAGNGGPPTAPSNPDSNLSNNALGYFSAHTTEKKSAIIK